MKLFSAGVGVDTSLHLWCQPYLRPEHPVSWACQFCFQRKISSLLTAKCAWWKYEIPSVMLVAVGKDHTSALRMYLLNFRECWILHQASYMLLSFKTVWVSSVAAFLQNLTRALLMTNWKWPIMNLKFEVFYSFLCNSFVQLLIILVFFGDAQHYCARLFQRSLFPHLNCPSLAHSRYLPVRYLAVGLSEVYILFSDSILSHL